jgi:phospholipase C
MGTSRPAVITRRRFLVAGAAAGGAAALGLVGERVRARATGASLTDAPVGRSGGGNVQRIVERPPAPLAAGASADAAHPALCASLHDIDHVVIVMQENRSFDHYFGTYPGVRGFGDRAARRRGAFTQSDPLNRTRPPAGTLLPFHFDSATSGECTSDISHEWTTQHAAWNGGAMDRWVVAHNRDDGPSVGYSTMGYYRRADLSYYYALADAFTLCDAYHCSVMGPTDPNRLYSMSGTIDPSGKAGGPVITNPSDRVAVNSGIWSWTTMPERLQARGISWKIYQPPATHLSTFVSNNMLQLFTQYQDPTSPLYRNAFLPTFPGEWQADVAAGALPQVSWLLTSSGLDEHPPSPVELGEIMVARALGPLMANRSLWAKTVVFLTYDENGGFFDHVAPPVPPPGTPGEELTTAKLPAEAGGIRGPIGLGFRVPNLVISPFSRGGFVCSDRFDHTSLLRFIETRFGVEVPNLSAWRRAAVGDLTSALNMAAPDFSVPRLPEPAQRAAVLAECVSSVKAAAGESAPTYPLPAVQTMPGQEFGQRRRPSGLCSSGTHHGPSRTQLA